MCGLGCGLEDLLFRVRMSVQFRSFFPSPSRADHPLPRQGSGSKGTVGYFPEKLSDRGMILTSHLHVMSSPPSISLHAQRQLYLYITLFSDFISYM
jgi:hypothetical protein